MDKSLIICCLLEIPDKKCKKLRKDKIHIKARTVQNKLKVKI